MKVHTLSLLLLATTSAAFVPVSFKQSKSVVLKGYLDNLSDELYGPPEPEVNPDEETYEATLLDKKAVENHGVGDWSTFVDFNEFDGGDGQMGVAGDGQAGLEKFGDDVQAQLVKSQERTLNNFSKSRERSARNAWGSSTGYSDKLREQGVDTARAQQLENWANQQELKQKQRETDRLMSMDEVSDHEEDWRMLSKYGAERLSDFNYDEEFGAVTPGSSLDGTIELVASMSNVASHSFSLANPYMGYADFRAALTPETGADWQIEPKEGSLSKTPIEFVMKYRPSSPVAQSEGFLVIETEDFKMTWKLIGSTG